jgi:hypothetical protein
MAAWHSATGEDLFDSERIWREGVLDWFLMGLRGDSGHIRQGDAKIFKGLHHHNRQYGLLVAKAYGNGQAQWFAERAEEVSPAWGPYAVPEILWRDAEVEPEAPSGPTSRLFRQVGVAIVRDSWDPNAVLASFRAKEVYTVGHTHRDNCSFTLYFRGALALDSGVYDNFGSEHHRNYYTRTVAHNSITVFDPDEKFSLYGEVHANDGGQRWLQVPEDVPGYWPGRADDTIERDDGYRLGGIVRYEDTDDYTYVVGDGGASYSGNKVTEFLRHFLWLKGGSGWDHPVCELAEWVILFDFGSDERLHYVSSRPRASHLIFGADPLAEYDLFTNGMFFQGTIRATAQGTLRFEMETPGQVMLLRQAP